MISLFGELLVFLSGGTTQCTETWFRVGCRLSLDDMSLWQLNGAFASLLAFGAAVIGGTVAVKRHYRCPKCESIPLGPWASLGPTRYGLNWGLDLKPSVCAKCGARLR
jgi:hypothetical protein